MLHLNGHDSERERQRKCQSLLAFLSQIVGITLARVSASARPIPGTEIPIREALGYISALLGAAVSFINERFDPAGLRRREVALGDLIYLLGKLEEDTILTLENSAHDNAIDLKTLLDDLRKREDAILEKAEEWKAGVRRIMESQDAA